MQTSRSERAITGYSGLSVEDNQSDENIEVPNQMKKKERGNLRPEKNNKRGKRKLRS